VARPQRFRTDEPVRLDEAQRARQLDLDVVGAGPRWRQGDRVDRKEIESAAVGAEPTQPRLDHRLLGEAGVLDGAPDQHEANSGFASRRQQSALFPWRRQHERVRHAVVAGEDSALAARCRLEQVGIDATRLERAARAGGEPGDADRALERAAEAAAPGGAHIARHPHRLPRAKAKIEACNLEGMHRREPSRFVGVKKPRTPAASLPLPGGEKGPWRRLKSG